ncbi:MAG: helix-turn-helix domain-containing protein [Bacillota bacterium]|nr:helix-turn-helix domain-containing protein [Bacillota bacterium]
MEKEVLTPEEACSYLSISQWTLDNWVLRGLKRIKIGRKVYFTKEAIMSFLKVHEEPGL